MHAGAQVSYTCTVNPSGRTAFCSKRKKGSALVIALLFLGLFSAFAIVCGTVGSTSLSQAENQTASQQARLSAESGVLYLSSLLKQAHLPADATPQQSFDRAASYLAEQLDGSGAMSGASVQYDGTEILVPNISLGLFGGTFLGVITLADDDTIHVSVTGQSEDTNRTIGLNFEAQSGGGVFDYGIMTGGKVNLSGNARISGANDPSEAKVITTTSFDDTYYLTGIANIEGDVHATNPDGNVSMSGNAEIAGFRSWAPELSDHIHFGVKLLELPRPDPTVFEPFAINVLSGPTSGNRTFTNICIPAGTNPTFSGNIEIKGVIFIEVPNKVKFAGNLDLTGVIVTEDAGTDNYDDNYLNFSGNTTLRGVEELPDAPEFAALRDMPGSAILAPGFDAKFSGNFGTVGGTIAAEKLTLSGNAGGIVKGSVISYSDQPLTMTGNASITIDRSAYPLIPPGFTIPTTLSPIMSTYEEY